MNHFLAEMAAHSQPPVKPMHRPSHAVVLLFGMLALLCIADARAATAIDVRVSADFDDAEQDSGGGIQLNNDKLELGAKLWVGFRFNGINVPHGATITTAYLRIRSADSNNESTQLTLFGQAHDNAGTFTGSSNNISNRTRTSASVAWSPVPSWSNNSTYQTPEIKTIVQEIVNRAGWTHGNSLAILIRSDNLSGKRLAVSHDDEPSRAAILHVEYTLAAPVGHWALSETSGNTAADSSVFARHGTVSGPTNWSTRCSGVGVFNFNGSTNHVSVSNASQLQPNTALSIAAWVRGDSWGNGGDVDTILRKGEGNPNDYQLSITDRRVELVLDDDDDFGFHGNTVLATGTWYHVAATWDGSTVRIYVNGVLDNTPASRGGAIGTDTRPVYIGGRPGSDQLDGMLHDVRLYNRGLSPAEVAVLAGAAGHWKFTEGSGITAADSSGLGNTATLVGGATWTTDCPGNNALLTDGSGGIAQTGSLFTPPSEGTVAFWMQPTGNSTTLRPIFGLGDFWEVCHLADGRLSFDLCGDGQTSFSTSGSIDEAGRWYHVAATFNAADDSFAIYIDGQLHTSGTNVNPMTPQPAAILSFGTSTGSSQYWPGALRDVRIYSRRLCPSEFTELYGLVGHWKLDETSGNSAADASGFGRDGTVIGTATWDSGIIDGCLNLDGATQVDIPSLLGSPRNVTIAAWARLMSPDTGGSEIVSIGDYLAIRLDNGTISRAFFYNSSSWISASVSQTFAGAEWHHFAAVFHDDQDRFALYVDGVEAASVSTTATIPYAGLGNKTVLGAHGDDKSGYDFTGSIDDVRVYNRALCPSEIEALHDGGESFEGVRIIKWVEIQ